jgi:hypothetical protein
MMSAVELHDEILADAKANALALSPLRATR